LLTCSMVSRTAAWKRSALELATRRRGDGHLCDGASDGPGLSSWHHQEGPLFTRLVLCASLSVLVPVAAATPGPPPAGYTLARVSGAAPRAARDGLTRLPSRPADPTHLFAVRTSGGEITRYDLDMATGSLSNPADVATGLPGPLGLAFRGDDLYVS